jgi:hypothetical protein
LARAWEDDGARAGSERDWNGEEVYDGEEVMTGELWKELAEWGKEHVMGGEGGGGDAEGHYEVCELWEERT